MLIRPARAPRSLGALALLATAGLALSCADHGSGTTSSATFTTRDSAGIYIAENSVSTPPGIAKWSVDSAPSLTIGVAAGDSAYEFTSISGVRRLPNGMIVALNGQGESAFEFRFFDSTGKHIATHGRRGEGPGEFRWVNYFGSVGGDTIIAVDFPARRISWVSASRGFLRAIATDEDLFKKLLGADASGTTEMLVPLGDSLYAIPSFHHVPDDPDPFARLKQYAIVDVAAKKATILGRLAEARGTRIQLASGNTMVMKPETGRPLHVVDRTRKRICAALTSIAEIQCIDAAGKRLTIRWAHDEVPYTAADRQLVEERSKAAYLRRMPPEDAAKLLAAQAWPDSYAPFSSFQLDARGNFWIIENTLDASSHRATRWRILDAEGRLIAFAPPFPASPLALGSTGEIGVTDALRIVADSDGVQRVARYAIRIPPNNP